MLSTNTTETPENEQIGEDTQRYLTHIENKLYEDIQVRRRIDSGLLFVACQISACSLAWLLFKLEVTLSIIQVASFCVGLLPGLIDVGDNFNFSLSSENWEVSLGKKPLVGVVKLLIGGAVSSCGTAKITAAVIQTESAINTTYQEIRASGGWSFQLPKMGISLLIAMVGILLIGVVKKWSIKDEVVESQD